MIPIKVHVVVQSSVSNVEHIQDTVFSKGQDLLAVPRIGESLLIGNYVLDVIDVMHQQLSPIVIYAALSMSSEEMLNEEQIKTLSAHMLHAGWMITESNIHERSDDERVEIRRLN